jgi:hypothetical protein
MTSKGWVAQAKDNSESLGRKNVVSDLHFGFRPKRRFEMKKPIFGSILYLFAILCSGCTQWGTSILRPVDVWWACPDRNTPCSFENATLTLIQADNMLSGAKRDLVQAINNPMLRSQPIRLELAISRAESARQSVTPGTWNSYLADYVQAALDAEREAAKFWPKRTSLVP